MADDLPDVQAVSRAVVVPGAEYDVRHRRRHQPLIVEDKNAAIGELLDGMAQVPTDDTSYALMTWPTLAFVFLGVGRADVLGKVSSLHPGWLRFDDVGDRRIARPERIEGWLRSRGWSGPHASAT